MAAKVTGVTEIHSNTDRPDMKAVTIPFAACKENFDQVSARYSFFQILFRHHPIYQVTYEDLAGPRRETVFADIQSFLKVAPQPLQSRLQKVNIRTMRDSVANYDALKDGFADTPYSVFFTE